MYIIHNNLKVIFPAQSLLFFKIPSFSFAISLFMVSSSSLLHCVNVSPIQTFLFISIVTKSVHIYTLTPTTHTNPMAFDHVELNILILVFLHHTLRKNMLVDHGLSKYILIFKI